MESRWAVRNGLIYIAWFEYGFMAAHKDTMNLLRSQKPEWLSRDSQGSEVAPNGFVWLNPLHPEVQKFLLNKCFCQDVRLGGASPTTRSAYFAQSGSAPLGMGTLPARLAKMEQLDCL